MSALTAALLSLATLSPAAPTATTLPAAISWTGCADDDAECDAETEDDGDLCSVADCGDDD